jgi:hypothetical protein
MFIEAGFNTKVTLVKSVMTLFARALVFFKRRTYKHLGPDGTMKTHHRRKITSASNP